MFGSKIYVWLALCLSSKAKSVVDLKLRHFTHGRFDSRSDSHAKPNLIALTAFGRLFESNRPPPHVEARHPNNTPKAEVPDLVEWLP